MAGVAAGRTPAQSLISGDARVKDAALRAYGMFFTGLASCGDDEGITGLR